MNTVYRGSTGDRKLLQGKIAGKSFRTEDVERLKQIETQRLPATFQKSQRVPTPGISDALARLRIQESLWFMTRLTDIQLSPRTKATCTTFGTNTHKRTLQTQMLQWRPQHGVEIPREKNSLLPKFRHLKKRYASSSKLWIDSSKGVLFEPAVFYGITS
jgi:hypothetical protein